MIAPGWSFIPAAKVFGILFSSKNLVTLLYSVIWCKIKMFFLYFSAEKELLKFVKN